MPTASGLAVLGASLNLLGWALGSQCLVQLIPLPGAGIMMPNTALGLLMCGAALWLLHVQEVKQWRRWLGRVLAFAAGLLGALSLVEYTLNADLGIDLLLFRETVQGMVSRLPGRPSPMSSINFCLMGPALLLLHVKTRREWYPARLLASGVMLLATQSLLSYVYMEETLLEPERLVSPLPPFTPMAAQTAGLFLALSLGVLTVHPERGLIAVLLREDVGGLLARRLFPAAIFIPLMVGGLHLLGEKLGLYGATFGLSLVVLFTTGMFLLVTGWNAKTLSQLDAARQHSEQALRDSEARFAGIVSNSTDAIILVDEALRISLFNPAAEHIFGYPSSEALGQPLDMLLPERLRTLHAHHIRDFVTSQQAARQMGSRQPVLGRRKSGEEFPAETSIAKLELGKTRFLTVTLRDITERKRAEEALQASEERFRTSFEDAPIGIALVSLEGRFLAVNGVLCELVGYSQKEFLTKTFQDITFPEDLEPDLANTRELLQGTISSYQMEKRYIHKAGHAVSVLLTGSLVRNPRGEPLHFIAQIQDISERKQIERVWRFLAEAGPRLAGSLSPLTTLATVAQLTVPELADWCVVDLVDDTGRMSKVESAAASPEKARILREMLTAYPHDPFRQGQLTADVLRTREPVLLPVLPGAVLERTAVDARHLELLRSLKPLSGMIVPLLGHEKILGVIILATSESGRRYGARDLTLAEELARRAALAIDNARLHEESEQATRIRDEVLQIVAHDLRTPLHVVSLSAGMLAKRLTEEQGGGRKQLEAIHRAVDQATRLIQDLLDVAQMEAGKLSVEPRPEETGALGKDATLLHLALADAKNIQLVVRIPENCSWVLADRDRVIQILSNLLGNALKFTPRGGQITFEAAPAGESVRFSVSDTGPGIPEEELPHLFEPFWQARKKEGAGLGLAIVKGLVEAHGGRIWVESHPGMGSTFFFTLPAAAPDTAHPTPPV